MDGEEDGMPGWITSKLEASHVARVKARLQSEKTDAPRVVGGYQLSNVGHQLLTWWFSVLGDRAMPCAEDFNMRSLIELAPYLEMASWEGPEALVVRLYGSALAAVSGHDRTGENIFKDETIDRRDADIRRLKLLHLTPCGVLTFWVLYDGQGQPFLIEALTLPLAAGVDEKPRVVTTFMPVDRKSSNSRSVRWETMLDMQQPHGFSGEIFIDVGRGVPDGNHQHPEFIKAQA